MSVSKRTDTARAIEIAHRGSSVRLR